MGSSMNSPSKSNLRNPQSRLSARSFQKSERKSVLLDRRCSFSASKLQQSFRNEQN